MNGSAGVTAPTYPLSGRTVCRLGGALAIESAVVAMLLVLAVAMRVVSPVEYEAGAPPGDEGIRGSQLLLMQAGYRPFRDIYASQGPLLLDLLYPLFSVYGGTLVAARLAVATYSLVAIVASYWVGRQMAGPVGAAAAALLLILSPTYLQNSRQALAEVVALGPATLAVGAALAFQRNGRHGWLATAGVLLSLSLLIKPITLAAVLAVGLAALLARRQGRMQNLLILASVGAGVALLGVLALGPEGVFEQIVSYRVRASEIQEWRFEKNWAILVKQLSEDQPGLFGLAALGGILLMALARWAGLPLVVWGVGAGLLLLVYTPLSSKHVTTMIPPIAILAGAGLGCLWRLLRAKGWSWRGTWLIVLPPLTWYLWSLQVVIGKDLELLHLSHGNESPRFSWAADAVRTIETLTEPTDFVLTDFPFFAILARRPVPPPLADPSETRVSATELTATEIASAATTYPSKVVVLRTDRFRLLPGFQAWLGDRYQLVKVYEERARPEAARYIYLRRDADFERARVGLTAGFVPGSDIEFAGELRLTAYSLERTQLPPGGATALSMAWEASRPFTSNYKIVMKLVAPAGHVVDDHTLGLGDQDDVPNWQSGRWVIQVWPISLSAKASPGRYHLTVGVYDNNRRRVAPVTSRPADRSGTGEREIPLAVLDVP